MKKQITFLIVQEGFSFEKVINNIDGKDKGAILKQIKGTLMDLMLLRKTTGQQLGLKLNQPIGFVFKVGRKNVNTLDIAEKLGVRLTIGNKSARIKKFFNTVEKVTDFMLRGNKAYSDKEIDSIINEIEEIVGKEAEARAEKALAKAEVSAN